jgi:hypothetical protein
MKRMLIVPLIAALVAPLAVAAPPPIGELLRSVPESARVVVAVDSAALREVPRVQEWLLHHQAWTGADQDLRRFLADAALDPVHDVDAMLVALLGEGSGPDAVAFFAGRYDPTSLAAALLKRGAEAFTLANVQCYRLPSSDHHAGEPPVLAQPSPDLIIVGDESAVRATLAPPHAVPQLVASEVAARHIDIRAPFWMVATVPSGVRQEAAESSGEVKGNEPVRGVIVASGTVQKVAMQAFLDDSLKVSGVARADTPENADLLRDAVKGALAVARLHAQGNDPELVDVLRDIEVRVSKDEVSIAGAVPLAVLDKLGRKHGTPCGPADTE